MHIPFAFMDKRIRLRAPAAGVLLALASSVAAAAHGPGLVLRYGRPAPDNDAGWERKALPIGNGRIGAMVFGQPGREHVDPQRFETMSMDGARSPATRQ